MFRKPARCRQGEGQSERGATLVEFAFILPIFILFIFGIIDFGWAFSQNLDVKQGAREGGRILAVNGGVGASATARCQDLQAQIKNRTTELTNASETILLTFTDSDGDGVKDVGELGGVTLRYPLSSLSGVSNTFLSGTMSSTVTMRLEQTGTWSVTDGAGVCQ
jgi:Flp pilus assembly protein TadG